MRQRLSECFAVEFVDVRVDEREVAPWLSIELFGKVGDCTQGPDQIRART